VCILERLGAFIEKSDTPPPQKKIHFSENTYSDFKNKNKARNIKGKGKGNAVPLQAWSGPEGSRKLRFPDFMTTAQMLVVCQPYAPVAFTPSKYTWYSFLLEAESTPGP
jgi:hypothetical protein